MPKHTNVESFRYFGHANWAELEYGIVIIFYQITTYFEQEEDTAVNDTDQEWIFNNEKPNK